MITVEVRGPRPVQVRGPHLAFDRAKVSPRSAFKRAVRLEESYAKRLRSVARQIGDLVRGMWAPDDPNAAAAIENALRRHSDTLEGWARAVAGRMVTEVAARDRKAWIEVSREMGRALGTEIAEAPTGALLRQRMADQVTLIRSLPLEAAERVHQLALEGITQGRRASEIADDIMASGKVARSRADLIARTEVSRTATELNRARAEHVGCTHFIWRTAGDGDVRASHRKLNGKAFRFDDPPECDPGHRALPGGIWNCRCYAEPVIPDA